MNKFYFYIKTNFKFKKLRNNTKFLLKIDFAYKMI